jgi:hypothetical protein
MKRILTTFLASVCLLGSIGTPLLLAHHGRGDTYVTDRTIEIKGTINSVRWRNPHIAYLVDVTDENGEVTTWTIEHSNVSTLARLGYGRQTLRPGMEITAEIYPGTQDRPIGLNRKVTLEDGTEIFIRGGNDADRYNPLNDLD